jgi:hypothetical protein
MKRLRVSLIEEARAKHALEQLVSLDEDGATLYVGTAPDAELSLPRATFLDVGRRQAAIAICEDSMAWIEGGGNSETRVDLHLGSQRVLLGTHAFTLTIEEVSSDTRARRAFIAS